MDHDLAGLQAPQQIRYEKLAALPGYRSSDQRQEVIRFPISQIATVGEWGESLPIAALELSISK
jgi:hypothetical protein